MPEHYRTLQGFKDVLPDEQPYWRFVEETAAEVVRLASHSARKGSVAPISMVGGRRIRAQMAMRASEMDTCAPAP